MDYDHNYIIMTINFVSKVSKIKNSKEKNYYVYRINVPSDATKDLGLKHGDHIFIKAKKAEWYHMLNWDTMSKTWSKLPSNVKNAIIEDGLIDEPLSVESTSGEQNKLKMNPITSSGISYFQHNTSSG